MWKRKLYLIKAILLTAFFAEASGNRRFGEGVKRPELYIGSDSFYADKKKRTITFKGSVVICFDDMEAATAEAVILYEDSNFKTTDKIILPFPVAAKRKDGTILKALKALYSFKEKKLTLEGGVEAVKENKILKTDKLVYYAETKNLIKRKE